MLSFSRKEGKGMITEKAKWKKKVISFFEEFGLAATLKAFGVSKSTVYLWRQKLRQAQGDVTVLNDLSRAPNKRREMKVTPEIIKFIREKRNEIPNLGKEKIKPLLDKFCREKRLKTISVSTIGRIIKRHQIYFPGGRITPKGKMKIVKKERKLRRGNFRPEKPGQLLQIDALSLFENEIKRYVFSAIDVKSKFAFSYLYRRLNSKNACDFFRKLQKVAPFQIERIQTDIRSEFGSYFSKYQKKNRILHYFNYPRHPQSNSVVERYHRSLREEFISFRSPPPEQEKEFNQELVKYLIFYNTQRSHKALDNFTPVDYLIKQCNFSKMLGTHTKT